MLDLLEAGEKQRRPRVLVGHEAPHLGEQLGVGLVAAHDLHPQRADGVLGQEQGGPLGLTRGQMDLGGRDSELSQRLTDLDRGGTPAR